MARATGATEAGITMRVEDLFTMINSSKRQGVGLVLLLGLFWISVSYTSASAQTLTPDVSWFEKQASVPNLLLIATWLVHLGMYRQQFRSLLERVERLDKWVDASPDRMRDQLQSLIRREEFSAVVAGQNSQLTQIQSGITSLTARVDRVVGT